MRAYDERDIRATCDTSLYERPGFDKIITLDITWGPVGIRGVRRFISLPTLRKLSLNCFDGYWKAPPSHWLKRAYSSTPLELILGPQCAIYVRVLSQIIQVRPSLTGLVVPIHWPRLSCRSQPVPDFEYLSSRKLQQILEPSCATLRYLKITDAEDSPWFADAESRPLQLGEFSVLERVTAPSTFLTKSNNRSKIDLMGVKASLRPEIQRFKITIPFEQNWVSDDGYGANEYRQTRRPIPIHRAIGELIAEKQTKYPDLAHVSIEETSFVEEGSERPAGFDAEDISLPVDLAPAATMAPIEIGIRLVHAVPSQQDMQEHD